MGSLAFDKQPSSSALETYVQMGSIPSEGLRPELSSMARAATGARAVVYTNYFAHMIT